MNNLPSWVTRVQSIWFAVAAFLAVLAAQGVDVPDFLVEVLSEQVWNALIGAVSGVLAFVQVVRAIFSKEDADVSIKDAKPGRRWIYAVNPFKLRV